MRKIITECSVRALPLRERVVTMNCIIIDDLVIIALPCKACFYPSSVYPSISLYIYTTVCTFVLYNYRRYNY